jgi:hypothetical protein
MTEKLGNNYGARCLFLRGLALPQKCWLISIVRALAELASIIAPKRERGKKVETSNARLAHVNFVNRHLYIFCHEKCRFSQVLLLPLSEGNRPQSVISKEVNEFQCLKTVEPADKML